MVDIFHTPAIVNFIAGLKNIWTITPSARNFDFISIFSAIA